MNRYSYIWVFEVRGEQVEEFLRHYDSAGTWAQLFRRAPGYIGTRLLRDRNNPLRFVTVDEWASEKHYRAFRLRFSAEYEALDKACEGLTSAETALGEFQMPTAPRVFENASLEHARFTNIDLGSSHFSNVNLRDSRFENIALAGAQFTDVSFANASITDSNLEGMTINGILVSELLRIYQSMK